VIGTPKPDFGSPQIEGTAAAATTPGGGSSGGFDADFSLLLPSPSRFDSATKEDVPKGGSMAFSFNAFMKDLEASSTPLPSLPDPMEKIAALSHKTSSPSSSSSLNSTEGTDSRKDGSLPSVSQDVSISPFELQQRKATAIKNLVDKVPDLSFMLSPGLTSSSKYNFSFN